MKRTRIAITVAATLLLAIGAHAASYLQTDGVIVDPIQSRLGGDLAYTGANLRPNADLANAELISAYLHRADLANADLSSANLFNANLAYADLSGADLDHADLTYAGLDHADLTDANMIGANLYGVYLYSAALSGADLRDVKLERAIFLGYTTGSAFYNAETDFTWAYSGAYGNSALFDPVAAGWTFVPEPNGTLLGIVGLLCIGLLARRRASA